MSEVFVWRAMSLRIAIKFRHVAATRYFLSFLHLEPRWLIMDDRHLECLALCRAKSNLR